MKLAILAIGTVLCIIYLDTANAVKETLNNPVSQINVPSKTVAKVVNNIKKPGNGSVIAINHNRVKRCARREHWTHRCRGDCECAKHRYCSSYGFCHERSRQRRQEDEYDDGGINDTESIDNERY